MNKFVRLVKAICLLLGIANVSMVTYAFLQGRWGILMYIPLIIALIIFYLVLGKEKDTN